MIAWLKLTGKLTMRCMSTFIQPTGKHGYWWVMLCLLDVSGAVLEAKIQLREHL